MKTPEQIAELNKSILETTMRVAKISLDNAERLSKLQMDAARSALEDNTRVAKALAEAKDVQDMMALRAKLAEGAVEKAMAYSRSIYDLASQTQAELNQLMEERVSSFNRDVVAAMDVAMKSAPAGSDVAMAAMKSTVAAATAAVDSMTKAAKQVADFADASVKAASSATANAMKAGTGKK